LRPLPPSDLEPNEEVVDIDDYDFTREYGCGDYSFLASAKQSAETGEWRSRIRIYSNVGKLDAAMELDATYPTSAEALAAGVRKGRTLMRFWKDVGARLAPASAPLCPVARRVATRPGSPQ